MLRRLPGVKMVQDTNTADSNSSQALSLVSDIPAQNNSDWKVEASFSDNPTSRNAT